MKTREQIREEVAKLDKRFILLSMPTGLGKTFTALSATYKQGTPPQQNVLIVYPKIAIEDSWRTDIEKWGFSDKLDGITFTTYNSLAKHTDKVWDMIIFDEGHHITDRVVEIIQVMKFRRALVLSATVKSAVRWRIASAMPGLYTYKVVMKDAIDSEILPDPYILLVPLTLNILDKTEVIVKNPKVVTPVREISFEQRNLYYDKKTRYIIRCTEAQALLDFDQEVEKYKRKALGGNAALKNLWMHAAGERLKWLASKKTNYVKELLKKLQNERTLTFCASIEQTEEVGKNCIHSKNKIAKDILDAFNTGKIKHITACNMLDEGVNLTSCRVGIFANINASERIQIQRIGRILRHSKPIIIIPYYRNTREEEIVDKMIEGYNPSLIRKFHTVEDITLPEE